MAVMKGERTVLRDGERIDDTGFGGFRVIQSGDFSYGIDAVLLAAFAAGETGASGISCSDPRIADLGSGNGIVSFVIAHKIAGAHTVGIESDAEYMDRAVRGAVLNGTEDRTDFIRADVKDIYNRVQIGKIADVQDDPAMEGFDAAVSNPPYFRRGSAIVNAEERKKAARHETTASLDDFLMCACALLKPRGDFYMVHRPSRLTDILTGMRSADLEPKELQMVVPRAGQAPNILLVHGVKNGGNELKILPDIVVHAEDAEYTEQIERIYERRTLLLNERA